MLMVALSGAEMSMRDLGVKIEPGSGVAAAQEYYRSAESTYGSAVLAAAE